MKKMWRYQYLEFLCVSFRYILNLPSPCHPSAWQWYSVYSRQEPKTRLKITFYFLYCNTNLTENKIPPKDQKFSHLKNKKKICILAIPLIQTEIKVPEPITNETKNAIFVFLFGFLLHGKLGQLTDVGLRVS